MRLNDFWTLGLHRRDGLVFRSREVCRNTDRVERGRCDAREDRWSGRHNAAGVRRAIFNVIVGGSLSDRAHRIVDVFRNGVSSQLKALPGARCPTTRNSSRERIEAVTFGFYVMTMATMGEQ